MFTIFRKSRRKQADIEKPRVSATPSILSNATTLVLQKTDDHGRSLDRRTIPPIGFIEGLDSEQSSKSVHELGNRSYSSSESSADLDEKPTSSKSSDSESSVGFWSAKLAKTRKEVFFRYVQTLFILCIAVLIVLSMYWGIFFEVKEKMKNISVAVVSFDGIPPYNTSEKPIVGHAIIDAVNNEITGNPGHLGFKVQDPSQYDNDPMKVHEAVSNEDVWAAIVINSNASYLLRDAVRNGNSTYDPHGSGQIIYNQARDIESFNFYIIPTLDRLAKSTPAWFSSNWTRDVLHDTSLNISIYSQSPQALSPAVGFTIYNLRPFDPPVAIPTITIGLIYLIIISFFGFSFFIPTHMKFVVPDARSPHKPLHFHQLVIYRWLATLTTYFFLSLCYSLVSLAFQIPFNHTPPGGGHWLAGEVVNNANYLGHATFFVFWMLNFIGMAALGLACENMAMLLSALSPLPWSAIFLIFWVITNVSTGFYAIELMSDFYKWGYVWPLRQIVQASKTLVFGTRSNLGFNFGVLFMWVGLGTALFPFACWVMKWKNEKDKVHDKELASRAEE